MKQRLKDSIKIIFLFTNLLGSLCLIAQKNLYPVTKTVDVSDTYFGKTYHDPYRWLENIKDTEVTGWFKAQAEYTNAQLARIPNQERLINELKEIDKQSSTFYGPSARRGTKYFYNKITPGEQTPKFFYREGKTGEEVLLFDPQKFVEGKTFQFGVDVNEDGSKVLFNLSEGGAELGDVRIMDVKTGKFLPDVIPHASGAFIAGNKDEITYWQAKSYDTHDLDNWLNTPCKLHVLGDSPDKDLVLASAQKNPELKILPRQTPLLSLFKNSDYMILGLYTVENNLTLYYAPKSEMKQEKINWKPLTTEKDEVRQLYVHGNDIYFLTSKDNPNFKIIKTTFTNPDIAKAVTILAGTNEWKIATEPPNRIQTSRDYLVVNETRDGLVSRTWKYHFSTGKKSIVDFGLKGNVGILGISEDDNEIIAANVGWTTPVNLFLYDLETDKLSKEPFHVSYTYPNLENLVYEEVEVTSHDGVKVPLSIIYDKTKISKDGSNIAYMEGYGAYGMSSPVVFNPFELVLLNRGVIVAHAHVRGGGEKGNDWYLAGKKETKPNTWKDFNACAEWLINNKYTSADRLGIEGASAGGILIGRAITERPDLYKAAIINVGVLNSMRLEFTPNGPANIPEFGSVKNEKEINSLYEMDAYHHIQKGVKYPAQLIKTGFNDPRVESYIPGKFAARMQKENGSDNPVFLHVNYQGGHFGGSTKDEQFEQMARDYAFLMWQCGDKEFQVK